MRMTSTPSAASRPSHIALFMPGINDIDAAEKLIKYANQFRKLDETKESVTKRLVDSADYDRRTCVHLQLRVTRRF